MKLGNFITISIFLALPIFLNNNFSALAQESCPMTQEEIARIINEINNQTAVKRIKDCAKANRHLVAELILLDPDYFSYASSQIRDDEEFISEFVAQNPKILDYISDRLKSDPIFFSKMARFYPNALEYASSKLTDNKAYMMKMVAINPKNFSWASERLQDDFELAMLAISKSGKMIKYASGRLQNNYLIAKQAVSSYTGAIDFIGDKLKKNQSIINLSRSKKYDFLEEFNYFLAENYQGLPVGPDGSRGYRIVNLAKNFPKKQLVNRPYITKWQETPLNDNQSSLELENKGTQNRNYKLITNNRNDYGWKLDFAKYPSLIKEIENIFKINQIDQNTIDALNTVSLWQVSRKPLVVAFDLYLLREIESKYLKDNFLNITLISAIAQKKPGKNNGWEISIVDAIFDADIKMDISYENGHKRYKIWDIYQTNKKDQANKKEQDYKVLFKVEDKDAEYFELFAPQPNGRYVSIFRGGGYYNDNF